MPSMDPNPSLPDSPDSPVYPDLREDAVRRGRRRVERLELAREAADRPDTYLFRDLREEAVRRTRQRAERVADLLARHAATRARPDRLDESGQDGQPAPRPTSEPSRR